MKNIELGEFPFVKMFVWENKFTYYTLSYSYKDSRFLEWMKKNRLTEIPDLHIRDVIDIYDKIYDHS